MTQTAVLLDLDGTLADSRPGIEACFRHMLTELGHDPRTAGDLSWAVGPPIAVSIGRLLGQYGDQRVEEGLAIYRARYSAVGLYECTVFPGVVSMLEAMRAAGHVMCIATSKRRDFAERVMDYLNLRGYVHGVYGALPGGGLDVKSDLVAHVLAHENLVAETAIMLGDRCHDIHAAQANRLRSIGAAWGYGGATELREEGADAIAERPADVPKLVGSLLPR
jgi:phosphoglycolate phosphatase